jgi:NTP pyrophosphatase (non-canonical NTP hydrolase)
MITGRTLQTIQREIGEWHQATFPGGTAASAARHLIEEADELYEAIHRPGLKNRAAITEEAADVLLLLIAAANKLGIDLEEAVNLKMSKNHSRRWALDPATGYRKHIEE